MFSKILIGAAALGFASLALSQPAKACSLVSYADNGHYVGGDLTAQIAAKAEMIQIVRVTAKYLVSRTYSEGAWYLNFGNLKVPSSYPEYTDEFVFKLEPVETLKAGRPVPDYLQDGDLRVRGFSSEALPEAVRPINWSNLNSLPDWLPDRPADGGYAFISASQDASLGGGECARPYVLEIGQTLLAFRNSTGDLYPASGAFPLEIDVEFLTGDSKRARWSLNMQSLVPINDPDDAFVARLRQAIATVSATTRN